MKIEIKKLKFVNFKGFKNFEVEFSQDTTISGDNGTGKTSIVDGFLWLLFGKDSEGRTDFHIKHLNKGKTQRVSEVEGILSLDGKETILKRSYKEKWVKRRGNAEEEFAGHESEYFIDDVPASAGEYKAYVDSLCKEEVFRMITNPSYFPNLKKEVKRNMLLEMSGNIDEIEIINSDTKFQKLFEDLENGETLEKYKAKVAAKKATIKKAIEDIPARIDELERSTPAAEDWAKIEAEITSKQKGVADIESQIVDASKSYQAEINKKTEILKEIQKIKDELFIRKNEVKQEQTAVYYKEMESFNKIKNIISVLEDKKRTIQINIQSGNIILVDKEAQKNKLLEEFNKIKLSNLTFLDADFNCPTCGKPFDNSEEKRNELTEKFNLNKSKQLEECKNKGTIIVNEINELKIKLHQYETELNGLVIPMLPNTPTQPSQQEIDKAISKDSKCLELQKKIESITVPEIQQPDTDELKETKSILIDAIDELKAILSKREQIETMNKRKEELKNELIASNQELARLEGVEFVITNFNKKKMTIVEERVNSLFSIVKFRMFETQINGGEVETCEEMVGGIPFNGALNNAARINAGLDIINAICKHIGIYAPIFVDNAESINNILQTNSQQIKLVVSENKNLIIKNN